jgi:hypothetical protein
MPNVTLFKAIEEHLKNLKLKADARKRNAGEVSLSLRPTAERFGTHYRGFLLTRKCAPLGPYSRTIPRVSRGSQGVGRFFVGKVPL